MEHVITLLTGPGGALVFALVILWAGVKRYWVFGWAYTACIAERDEWKEVALRGTTIAERAVTHQEIKEATDEARR